MPLLFSLVPWEVRDGGVSFCSTLPMAPPHFPSLYSKFAVPKFPPIKLTGGTTPKACKEAMGQREGRLALGSVNRVTVAVLSHSLARGGDLLMDVV